MTTWFTADLHFGHTNIIEYTDRPFSSVAEMNEGLIDLWNETVSPTDTIWILGDFAMGQIRETLEVVPRLQGHKILICGNHDRGWHGHGPKAVEWQRTYLDAGFQEIYSGTRELTLEDQQVIACHFPHQGDSHDQERFVKYRPPDNGEWLIHGHVHITWAQHDKMINVGVDVSNYRPLSEAYLAELVRTGPMMRHTHTA